MKIRTFCTLMAFLLGLASVHAKTDNIQTADSLYEKGRYADALAIYNDILKNQGSSAQLLYNMGNAYYQDGEPAKAMLCYERALKFSPGNKEIKNNIEFIRHKVEDRNMADLGGKMKKLDYDDATFTEGFYIWVAKGTASNTWALLAALAFLLTVGCAALYIFANKVMARKMGFFIGFIFLGFSVMFLLFGYWSRGHYYSQDEAVVTIFKTPLLSEPKEGAEDSTTPLNAGTKVIILEALPKGSETPEWYKVKMNQDFIGWIKSSDLEII